MKKHTFLLFFLLFFVLGTNAQTWLWAKQGIGSGVYDITQSVAIDDYGNSYLAGQFSDTLRFGSIKLKSSSYNAFLVKYDSSGNMLWAKQSTSTSGSSATNFVVVDKSDNIYVAGAFGDSVNFGGHIVNAKAGMFLTKYDNNGNVIWAKQSYGGGTAQTIVIDGSNNVYVIGNFYDKVLLGVDTLKAYSNSYLIKGENTFLAKYDSNGNVLWVKQSFISSSSASAFGASVDIDVAGNAYVTGYFSDTIGFGSFVLIHDYFQTMFITKYDMNGNVIWCKSAPGSFGASTCIAYSIKLLHSDNIVVTGGISGSVAFDNDTLTSPYGDIFLADYDYNGNLKWAKNSITLDSNSWYGYTLSNDNSNNIYLSCGTWGYTPYEFTFGADTIKLANALDPLAVIKLDSSGNALCSSIVESGGADRNGIISEPNGKDVYVGGAFWANQDIFGGDTLVKNGGVKWPFIARWQPCVGSPEGINEISPNTQSVKLYPNPNKGIFNLQLGITNQKSEIEIYNMLGEKIYSNKFLILNSNPDGYRDLIDIGTQPSGIYLYRVLSEEGNLVGSGKFVIAN